jgi:DNA primase
VGENGKEEWYGIFTNRIMFTIFNLQGGVTGFTARVWIDTHDTKAKYKNSILSPVFQKSHVIYNLYHALPYIKQLNYVIIVEGATDVAKMWQHGIRNVIAPCGTALMLQHLIILKYFTSNIITIFDSDAAGYQALKRVENLFNETNTKFRKLDLWKIPGTSKTDPDTYLEHFGVQAFYQQLQQLFNNWW